MPGVVVNEMSMVYDSSLMKMADQAWTKDRFQSLKNLRFGLGAFRGQSGKLRVGKDVIEKIEKQKIH
jgi:hypothetical protein